MRHDFAVDWMADFEAYAAALEAGGDASYASTLSRSLALVLDRWGRALLVAVVTNLVQRW